MNRIVSYSLFGLSPTYWKIIPAVLRAHFCIFPGWKLRIHYSREVARHPYWEVLVSLCSANFIQLECRSANSAPQLCEGMLWRLFPIWSGQTLDDVDLVACRDIDSLPTVRDRVVLEHFDSFKGSPLHAISDNVMHTVPLMGGMIAFHPKPFILQTGIRSIDDVVEFSGDLSRHGMDQTVLNLRLWPNLKRVAVQHRLSGSKVFAGPKDTFTEVPAANLSDIPREVLNSNFADYIGQRCEDPEPAFHFYSKFIPPDINRILAVEKRTFEAYGWYGYDKRG